MLMDTWRLVCYCDIKSALWKTEKSKTSVISVRRLQKIFTTDHFYCFGIRFSLTVLQLQNDKKFIFLQTFEETESLTGPSDFLWTPFKCFYSLIWVSTRSHSWQFISEQKLCNEILKIVLKWKSSSIKHAERHFMVFIISTKQTKKVVRCDIFTCYI